MLQHGSLSWIKFQKSYEMSKEKLARSRGGHRTYVKKTIEDINSIISNFSGSKTDRDKLGTSRITLNELCERDMETCFPRTVEVHTHEKNTADIAF